ncbi:MAG: hypothetical protein KDC00_06125 [Flavobacteriales bacterium]|nr:hypothetical protein [Flavobacteriales bacterium]
MIRIPALFILVLSFHSTTAQFYNWGWGPPISVTQVGANITCTVFDPVLNASRTESFSSVADWSHSDGVVATVSNGGVVRGIVYDIALGAFQEGSFNFVSGTTVVNSAGVVAWVSGSGRVGGAVYNPFLHQWREGLFSTNPGNQMQNRDGVVSWVSEAGTVGAAVYDPELNDWRSDQFSSNSGNVVQNRDGVVAWVSAAGSVGAAVYDPSLHDWRDEQFSSNNGNQLVLGQGVVAWRSTAGSLGAAAYDWTSNSWVDQQFSSSASNTMPTISDGTVLWSNSGGPQKYGFTSAHDWQNGVNTTVQCEYHVQQISGVSAPRVAYLWCLTIGASTYSHQCGDGHEITRRWAWKSYADPGSYTVQFNAFSSVSNTQCNGEVSFGGTTVDGTDRSDPFTFVVQGSDIRLSSDRMLGELWVLDAKGAIIHRGIHASNTATIALDLMDGVYVLRRALDASSVRFMIAR